MSLQSWQEDKGFEVAVARENGHNVGDAVLEGRVLLEEAIKYGVEPPEIFEPGVLIKGAVHHIFAGPGSGKTWQALWLIKNAIERGQRVAFFDTENGTRIVAERLAELGVDASQVNTYLWYFPSLNLRLAAAASFVVFLDDVKPALIVFDSWLDHLAIADLSENEATDIASWAARYSRPARDRGCTVVLLDHVPHDVARARGSTRKKDEVDVQWRLKNPKPFDRQTVGEIVLELQKDREAVLEQTVKFRVGGTENGFTFQRIGETMKKSGEEKNLTSSQKQALSTLKNFGKKGATFSEWWKVTGIEAKSTFGDAKSYLEQTGRVEKHERRYWTKCETQSPKGPTGPPPDISGHPSGMSERSGGSIRHPDRTYPNRTYKTEPEKPNREPCERDLDEYAANEDVAAFLDDPPLWWYEQAAACWRDGELDERRLNPLASNIACEVYGSAHRWREVLPAVRGAVHLA